MGVAYRRREKQVKPERLCAPNDSSDDLKRVQRERAASGDAPGASRRRHFESFATDRASTASRDGASDEHCGRMDANDDDDGVFNSVRRTRIERKTPTARMPNHARAPTTLALTESQSTELALVAQLPASTDAEKRKRDADVLEVKLRAIRDNVVDSRRRGGAADVSGSQAGAGSGEFHKYREARRRERERLDAIEREDEERRTMEEYRARVETRVKASEEKTAKNRKKRDKAKAKRAAKRAKTTTTSGGDDVAVGDDDDDGEEEEDAPAELD